MASGRQPRQVIYLSLDLLVDQPLTELAATVERARSLAGTAGGMLLLDEVTMVNGWQTAVKALWDNGVIDRDVVVCTGSSAVDLARGTAERLPGRRGGGQDHLVLPQTFSAFARALFPALPASPGLSLESLVTPEGQRLIDDVRVHGPQLTQALERYVRFGGLPAAVAEAASGVAEPSEESRRVILDSLVRESQRKGASEPAIQALLERVLRSLGAKTSWSHLAREMGVPLGGRRSIRPGKTDYRTMRDYIEFLAVGYFILIVYFWKPQSDSNTVSKDKKLYFGDPLLQTIARDYAPGLDANPEAIVENVIALALYRRYEPASRQIEGFLAPSDLHVWEVARRTEIDFVCGPRTRVSAVEVKYGDTIDRRLPGGMKRAFLGRPVVVATKNVLEFGPGYALVPAHLLLWALI